MKGPVDAFDEVHWNLAQLAAWVCLRDRELVTQHSDTRDDKPSASHVAVALALRQGYEETRWGVVLNQVMLALQEGKIEASGVRVGTNVRAIIDALDWADLDFKFDPDQAMETNSSGIWEPRWEKLKFRRAGILANWPEIDVHTATDAPPDIKVKELRAWLKHDSWTAAEAMLILHGKVPREPWLQNDELETHFPQAKVYLNRALQSGIVGERVRVDGRAQWIDTPVRWLDWAIHKISIPKLVQSAFHENRYAATPRVHYLRAKALLRERLQAGPQEIAMWVFMEELIAWQGQELGSQRFYFEWMPGDDYDYVNRLIDTDFSSDQLNLFQPHERWLTHRELIERWATSMTRDEALSLIRSRAKSGDLVVAHPLAGIPSDDGEPGLEDCLFSAADAEQLQAEFGVRPSDKGTSTREPADEEPVSPVGLISAEVKCRKWLEQLMDEGGSSRQPKRAYLAEAQQKFSGLSQRSFDTAWKQAISNTGNSQWSKPGRKS